MYLVPKIVFSSKATSLPDACCFSARASASHRSGVNPKLHEERGFTFAGTVCGGKQILGDLAFRDFRIFDVRESHRTVSLMS
jgi:hypothetical protein